MSKKTVVCDRSVCELCGDCQDVCPVGAITVETDSAMVDHDACQLCLTCADACLASALFVAETGGGS